MSKQNAQSDLPVNALAPDADLYAADPATDIINMVDYQYCDFYVHEGAGGTGTALITMEECDDVTPTNSTEILFRYRVAQTGDTFGDWTNTTSTSAGYTTIAGANKIVQIQVDADQLADGFPYVRIVLTEVVDDPCDAGVLAILSGPRYAEESPATALT